eukprot:7555168-Pyramimonas_sp.AAC.1
MRTAWQMPPCCAPLPSSPPYRRPASARQNKGRPGSPLPPNAPLCPSLAARRRRESPAPPR